MKGLGWILLACALIGAWPAAAQPFHRDHGGRRQFGPPGGQPGNGDGGRGLRADPRDRPDGSLSKEERRELNRDINEVNRELDQRRKK
jgi:hypothetical protein